MNEPSHPQLPSDCCRHGNERAFAELVRRQVNLVYSAARRLVEDPHLAEDLFLALAVQAAEVTQRLDGGAPLFGWLHVPTRNQAALLVRTQDAAAFFGG